MSLITTIIDSEFDLQGENACANHECFSFFVMYDLCLGIMSKIDIFSASVCNVIFNITTTIVNLVISKLLSFNRIFQIKNHPNPNCRNLRKRKLSIPSLSLLRHSDYKDCFQVQYMEFRYFK